MNAPPSTLKDVDQAAEELMALGCKVGALHINDGAARLGFLGEIRAFAEEVYQDIKDGVISAAEGVEALWDEHEALRGKAGFYLTNGITVAGGVAQTYVGATTIVMSRGLAILPGLGYIAHGTNNVFEGSTNIYKGPNAKAAIGPTRAFYHYMADDANEANMAYGSMDLAFSIKGFMYLRRKPNTLQLFRRDPINYDHSYKLMGKMALSFESIVNFVTIKSMMTEEKQNNN